MSVNRIRGHDNLRAKLVEGIARALKIDSPHIVPEEEEVQEPVQLPTRPLSEFSKTHPGGLPTWDFLKVWNGTEDVDNNRR